MLKSRITAVLLSACLLVVQSTVMAAPATVVQVPAGGAQLPAPKPGEAPQYEAKVAFLAIVLQALGSVVFDAFKSWLANRLTGGLGETPPTATASAESAAVSTTATDTPSEANTPYTYQNLKRDAADVIVAYVSEPIVDQMTKYLDAMFGAKAVVVGEPKTPLAVKGDEPNYQAAHVAILAVDDTGRIAGFRSVDHGFRTGERFKLRMIATFDGVAAIGNINPRGEGRQIFPPQKGTAVQLKAGQEIVIPAKADEFFQFAGATGTEQLVVTIIDPRAVGAAASTSKVYRQDEAYGSNFAQEVSPGTYPVISQAITLTHLQKD
jgi:hypothetical protein